MVRQTISDTQAKELLVTGEGVIVNAGQLERLMAERDTLCAEAATAHAAELRAALEHSLLGIMTLKHADIPMALLSVALEAERMANAALARTPGQSLAAVQARALREAANLIRQTTPSRTSQWDDYGSGKEDGRHYAIEQIESEAERLEKEAGL